MSITIENVKKTLGSHSIKPTPRRIEILKIILTRSSMEFTIDEIKMQVRESNPSVGASSISNTLILYRNTGIIKEVKHISEKHPKIGRPKTKFIFSSPPKSKLDNHSVLVIKKFPSLE